MFGKFNKKSNTKSNWKWIINIVTLTIVLCGSISLFSDLLLKRVNLLVAFIILIIIILTGITFDIIGIAITVADETPFHAMAAKKKKGAKIAIKLIRNADKVASICNDVVGDICGIVSGSVGALITVKIMSNSENFNDTIVGVIIGTIIGAITIVGKALGKSKAMSNSNDIVYKVSNILYLFKRKDKI